MSYFSYLPETQYELDNKNHIVKDILTRARFFTELHNFYDLYEEYEWTDYDSVESLALKYYGSVQYYWVILIFNEIHDIQFELPLTQIELEQYIAEKYGAAANSIRFWRNIDNKLIVDEPTVANSSIIPITNADYEAELNESKRRIRILRPELLTEFIKQFRASYEQ